MKGSTLFAQAAELARHGQFAEAVESYRRAARHLPGQPELHLQMAHALGLSGKRLEALALQAALLKRHPRAPELRVRMARDREEWLDFAGALEHWDHLATLPNRWRQDAAFHRIRLRERLNRLEEALGLWTETPTPPDANWGWHWLEARLAERNGEPDKAIAALQKGFALAGPEGKPSCAGALIRLHLDVGEARAAWTWIQTRLELRSSGAKTMRDQTAIPETPGLAQAACNPDPSQPGWLLLTGFARAGTTLMARRLREETGWALGEEHPFLRHAVDQLLKHRAVPETLAAEYWQAHRESGAGLTPTTPGLIDKNPAQAILAPSLPALFPEVKLCWMDRDPRDLWLSCVALEVPVNPVSCWWQEPDVFGAWYRTQIALRDHLADRFPPDRFARVRYEDLVAQPGRVAEIVDQLRLVKGSDAHRNETVVTSPSYAEVMRPVSGDRVGRWRALAAHMPSDMRSALEALADPDAYSR